jgi:hypothetical protein
MIGKECVVACLCPEARKNERQDCLHKHFVEDFGEERFPFDVEFDWGKCRTKAIKQPAEHWLWNVDEHAEPILFSRQRCNDEKTFLNQFSVPAHKNGRLLNGRVIVVHEGDDSGHGILTCSKEPSILNCAHIQQCQNTLRQLVSYDSAVSDATVSTSVGLQYRGAPFI